MEFVRRHLFFMVCGLAALGAVALGVMGLQRMPGVANELRGVETVYRQLTGLKPVNLAGIEAEQERIDLLLRDRSDVFGKAREMYGYDPLIADVFPEGDSGLRLQFPRAYQEAMRALMQRLSCGSPPTGRDENYWLSRIEDEKAERADRARGSRVETEADAPVMTPSGVLTTAGARDNAEARAAMAAAQRVYCFAVDYEGTAAVSKSPSLEFASDLRAAADLTAPELDVLWYAQVSYWIQKDVVDAIVAVNQEAADSLVGKEGNPWVGVMPIKDVVSVRVLEGFVPLDGDEVYGSDPDGSEDAQPPGTPETVFTHSGSNDWYEVVQYSVKLVMDVRDIPKFIDRLTSNSFHTVLRVSYVSEPPNKKIVGKVYGSEPTVRVVMDFETVLLGEVFRPMMPESVCDYYDISCPPREAEED